MSEEGDEVSGKVHDAIASVLQAGGAMVTKFTAAVEVIEPDGGRAIWLLASEGSQAWESIGMLRYALATEEAGITAAIIREGE